MNSVKCPQCGLVNFGGAASCKRCRLSFDATDAPADWPPAEPGGGAMSGGVSGISCSFCGFETSEMFCPRCRARVAPAPSGASYGAARGGGGVSARRLLWRVGVLAVLAAIGLGAYAYKDRIRYGKDASYVLLIRESEQFGKPLNVSISRNPQRAPVSGPVNVPSTFAEGLALVLEERGLVTFGVKTTQETRQVQQVAMPPTFSVNSDGSVKVTNAPPSSVSVTESVNHVGIKLTPEGEKEAVNWTESDASQWRVPIGKREIVGVDKVGEVSGEAGAEKLDVEFSWRWLPNALGKAFDDGEGVVMSHDRARMAVNALGWNSSKAYRAVAHLERQAGGEWRVASIEKSESYDKTTELSGF